MRDIRSSELAGQREIEKVYTEKEDVLLGQLGEIEGAMAAHKKTQSSVMGAAKMLMPLAAGASIYDKYKGG